MSDIDTLPGSELDEPVYRAILSRHPQINLFERVFGPLAWEVLYAVESLTNPRLRDEVGDIRLVAPEDRVYGEGASWIMAAGGDSNAQRIAVGLYPAIGKSRAIPWHVYGHRHTGLLTRQEAGR